VERFGITVEQIGDLASVADGSDDAVAALEELIGEVAPEAAADASDETSPPSSFWPVPSS
jgi:hypothetical protein